MSRGSHHLALGVFVCALAALLSGCQTSVNYPAPSISKLNPDHATAGDPMFILTITGGNLTPASTVEFNGTTLALFQFTSTASISVMVPAALVESPGQVAVSVFTPQPGGGTSQTLTFTIFAGPSPVPQVSSLVPSGVSTGAGTFTLVVKGTNFVAQSSVNVNGSARTTSFVDAAELQAAIPASDVANAGILQVSVVNPSPGGGASNSKPLTVTNPVPLLSSISPVAILAGGSGSQLAVTGSSFVPNSVVMINGSAHTTTFSNSTSLSAALTAADLAVAGMNQVEVVNPPPGGGTSNVFPFAVDPTLTTGLPVLVDVAPDGSQANNAICGAAPCPPGAVPTLATAGPSASQTGQLVAYASISTNLALLPSSQGLSEIYVRDTCLSTTGGLGGSSSCVPRNALVSVAPNGAAADAPSAEPSLDTAGTNVAYTSTASNLVTSPSVSAGAPRQVYVQPTCVTPGSATGCSAGSNSGAAALVSISADPVNPAPGNADSYSPQISPDGKFVAFVSQATNLLSPAITPANPQIYLYGACTAQTTGTAVTVSLGGKSNATTTTSSSGTYTFSGLADGSYTVTPSGEGFSFSPANQSVTVNGANVTSINFTGTSIPTIYSISGTITPASDGAGATVTLSGAGSATTTADALGNFTFTNISNGAYTVVPSKAGFSFSPSFLPATVNGGDVTGLSFTASTTAFNISGTVSPTTGGASAFLVLSVGATQIGTTTADGSGNFTFTGLANGTYTVTASNSGYSMSPASRPVTISGADVTGVNFTATALTTNSFSISGTVTVPPPPSCTQNVHLVSTPDGTTAANGPSSQPSVSSGGTFVAFASRAPNLLAVVNGAANPQTTPQQVYVQSSCITGAFGCGKTVTLVSTPDGTTPADGPSSEPSISSDGRFIAFASTASNLGVASGGVQQIYVRDTCAGVTGSTACTPATFLASTADGTTPANALSESPRVNKQCSTTTTVNASLCATGQFVAFASQASNLGPATQQGVENVFSRNTCKGLASTATCTPDTFLASQPAGASPPAANGDSIVPSVSGDGRTVSFISSATNLVTRDSNGLADVFLGVAVRSFQLTVTLKGATTTTLGSVSDSLSEISCRLASGTQTGVCLAPYLTGTSVTLTATAGSGSVFKGWSGGVTATQCPATTTTCTVTMTGDLAVTASFQ